MREHHHGAVGCRRLLQLQLVLEQRQPLEAKMLSSAQGSGGVGQCGRPSTDLMHLVQQLSYAAIAHVLG